MWTLTINSPWCLENEHQVSLGCHPNRGIAAMLSWRRRCLLLLSLCSPGQMVALSSESSITSTSSVVFSAGPMLEMHLLFLPALTVVKLSTKYGIFCQAELHPKAIIKNQLSTIVWPTSPEERWAPTKLKSVLSQGWRSLAFGMSPLTRLSTSY